MAYILFMRNNGLSTDRLSVRRETLLACVKNHSFNLHEARSSAPNGAKCKGFLLQLARRLHAAKADLAEFDQVEPSRARVRVVR
jgi:hypothetical protein